MGISTEARAVEEINKPANDPSELHKLQFDYAWKWFCFHADQRVKMFNYMLVVFGIFGAGLVNALHDRTPPNNTIPIGAIADLCFIAGVLAVIFMLLDRRNRDLVWQGEDILMHLERKAIFGKGFKIKARHGLPKDFGILWRQALEEDESKKQRRGAPFENLRSFLHDVSLGKHRILLPGISALIGAVFFAAGGWIRGGRSGFVFFAAGVALILVVWRVCREA